MDGFWFTSSIFQIEPGGDDEVNPGRFGRQLALWLSSRLEYRGYEVEPVIAEDWGRCLMISRKPFSLWVGCGNVDDIGEREVERSEIVWHCFPVAEVPFFKRLFGKPDTAAALQKLSSDLESILVEETTITLVAEP